MSVKKDDLVEVISGKDKGTQAKVLRAYGQTSTQRPHATHLASSTRAT